MLQHNCSSCFLQALFVSWDNPHRFAERGILLCLAWQPLCEIPQRLLACCWDGPVQIYTLNCSTDQQIGQGFPSAHHPIFINVGIKSGLGKAHVHSEVSPAETLLPEAQLSCTEWGCLTIRDKAVCFLKPEENVLSIWILFCGLLWICQEWLKDWGDTVLSAPVWVGYSACPAVCWKQWPKCWVCWIISVLDVWKSSWCVHSALSAAHIDLLMNWWW